VEEVGFKLRLKEIISKCQEERRCKEWLVKKNKSQMMKLRLRLRIFKK
jgi:hypothetical protein